MLCELGEKCREFYPRGAPALARRTTASQDHEVIARKTRLFLAKCLAYHPLDAVTVNRPRRSLPADDDADARPGQGVPLHEHTEVAANCRRPARQGRRILLAPQQAFRPRQRSGTRRVQALSRARPLARRARMTARPPRVRIRTRNPWVRLRRVFDG